jgi:hypothetical protein
MVILCDRVDQLVGVVTVPMAGQGATQVPFKQA